MALSRKEPESCVCGTKPEYMQEASLIDLLKCPGCGKEGKPFYNGNWEWLVEDWNLKMAQEKTGTGGDGI